MLDNLINVKLLGHPANWGIVWTVLLFGMVGWALIHRTATAPVADPST